MEYTCTWNGLEVRYIVEHEQTAGFSVHSQDGTDITNYLTMAAITAIEKHVEENWRER